MNKFAKFQKNILLKNHTSFHIGGPAEYFFVANTKQDLIKAIKIAKENNLLFFILGKGTNLLASDKGYKGVIINIQFDNYNIDFQLNSKSQAVKIDIDAGMFLSDLINKTSEKKLKGLEWAAGIPGTVGGAIRGNAGSFDGSMADIVREIEVLKINSMSNFQISYFKPKDCNFGYRDSIFKHNSNLIILSVKIQLEYGDKKEIKKRIQKNLLWRVKNQPLKFFSAGSIFKNKILEIDNSGKTNMREKENQKLFKQFPEFFEFYQKGVIPAAWLIEKCGLKGKKIGDVQISEKHSNFIVNLGRGKAEDVLKLIELTKQAVKNKFNIALQEEVVILE